MGLSPMVIRRAAPRSRRADACRASGWLPAITVALACLAICPIAGQAAAPQDADAATRLDTWLVAIAQHTPGVRDGATLAVATWSRDDLDGVFDLLKKSGVPQELVPLVGARLAPPGAAGAGDTAATTAPPSIDMNVLLERAALLHTDIAILNRDPTGYRLPSNGQPVWLADDGKHVGHATGTVHWAFARSLLDAIQPDPAADPYVRQWYRATSACLQFWREYSELGPHLSRALALFPNDAVLWLDSGTMHEAYAGPEIQSVLDAHTPSRTDLPTQGHGMIETLGTYPNLPTLRSDRLSSTAMERELADAEDQFRHALDLDPSLVEARIRLGHVIGMRGRHEQAVTELRQAVAASPPPALEFYAQLILGRELQALGQTADARRAATRAIALAPGAESARLLLSELDRDSGDQVAARTDLALLSKPADAPERGDPWWAYGHTHVPNVRQLVLDLWKTRS